MLASVPLAPHTKSGALRGRLARLGAGVLGGALGDLPGCFEGAVEQPREGVSFGERLCFRFLSFFFHLFSFFFPLFSFFFHLFIFFFSFV